MIKVFQKNAKHIEKKKRNKICIKILWEKIITMAMLLYHCKRLKMLSYILGQKRIYVGKVKVKMSHNLCGRRGARRQRPQLLQHIEGGAHLLSLAALPSLTLKRQVPIDSWGTVLKPRRANGHPSKW